MMRIHKDISKSPTIEFYKKTYQHMPWQKSFHNKLSFKEVVSSSSRQPSSADYDIKFQVFSRFLWISTWYTASSSSCLQPSRVIEKQLSSSLLSWSVCLPAQPHFYSKYFMEQLHLWVLELWCFLYAKRKSYEAYF